MSTVGTGGRAVRVGAITRTIQRFLMHKARVVSVQKVSPHFGMIDLEGETLGKIDWAVGQKIQVSMDAGLTARTYTPVQWDARHGGVRLLIYMHGSGPGSDWASNVREGDICHFVGPRRSIEFSGMEPQLALFGDETSFALARAIKTHFSFEIRPVLEVSDEAESALVLGQLGLTEATIVQRTVGDAHLSNLIAALEPLAAIENCRFVLTGKASSIQNVSRALKAVGVTSARIRAKAYWSIGKVGLD